MRIIVTGEMWFCKEMSNGTRIKTGTTIGEHFVSPRGYLSMSKEILMGGQYSHD